eukprot:TRINITY_DN103740_c0_g1_i1.p2 TRINITY_DN103740_c0_g1~~TRINITY_DN103740_c0_g1_i1.p2  ORF type:complete len:170 (-),score=38.80 TRINITY_DN103740_c0_g1_i1:204-713(-)
MAFAVGAVLAATQEANKSYNRNDEEEFKRILHKAQQDEGMGIDQPDDTRQLPPELAKQMVNELPPHLKEELASILQAQQRGEEQPPRGISPELARVLRKYQNRAGLGPGGRRNSGGDETWPMYLGIVLFVVIFCVMGGIYIQETFFAEPDPWIRRADEDPYWWFIDEDW